MMPPFRVKPEIIAECAHEVNRAYCQSLGDFSQTSWTDASDWQKQACINGVEYLQNNPNAAPEDSHANWLAEKLADGWTYGPEKDAINKTHPCCLPYAELPQAQRSKNYIFVAIVRYMIAARQSCPPAAKAPNQVAANPQVG